MERQFISHSTRLWPILPASTVSLPWQSTATETRSRRRQGKPGDSNTIVLTLTTPLAGSETITIAYTQGDVAAADNGILRTFVTMAVTNTYHPTKTGPWPLRQVHLLPLVQKWPGRRNSCRKTNLTYTW